MSCSHGCPSERGTYLRLAEYIIVRQTEKCRNFLEETPRAGLVDSQAVYYIFCRGLDLQTLCGRMKLSAQVSCLV